MDARPLQDPDRAPLTAIYLDGLLGAFDADPLDGRVVRVPARSPTWTTRPTPSSSLDVVGRRLLPPTRLLRSGALTRRPVPPARRVARRGLARRARRRRRCRLPRGRRRAAADRAPGCRSSSRCSTSRRGSCRRCSSGRPPAASASGCGPQLLRDAAAVIVGTEATARAPRAGCCTSGATGSGSCRWRRDRPTRSGARRAAERPAATARERDRRAARPAASATSSIRAATTPARTSPRSCEALAALAAAGRPDGPARDGRRGRRASCSWTRARTTARRSPGPRPARASARRWPTRPSLPSRARGGAHPRRRAAAILPVVSEAAGLPLIESHRLRDAGRRLVGRRAAGARRGGGPARGAARPGPPGRRAARRSGRTIASTTASSTAARERAESDRRTWADVARETRAVYAESGIRRVV